MYYRMPHRPHPALRHPSLSLSIEKRLRAELVLCVTHHSHIHCSAVQVMGTSHNNHLQIKFSLTPSLSLPLECLAACRSCAVPLRLEPAQALGRAKGWPSHCSWSTLPDKNKCVPIPPVSTTQTPPPPPYRTVVQRCSASHFRAVGGVRSQASADVPFRLPICSLRGEVRSPSLPCLPPCHCHCQGGGGSGAFERGNPPPPPSPPNGGLRPVSSCVGSPPLMRGSSLCCTSEREGPPNRHMGGVGRR